LKAREMVRTLNDMGDSARLCNEVRLKPLLSRLKDFTQGRNTLHYHTQFGSRFHIQAIGLAVHHTMDEQLLKPKNDAPDKCGSCTKCLQACPAKALSGEGFHRDKCLRQHMLRGTPVPVRLRVLMENRLLGCDICQQVCPYNILLPKEEAAGECFPLDRILKQDADTLSRLSVKIGKNMALPNRICAQACIVAGNSKEPAYLPVLDKLCHHPSPIIAEHAAWAVNNLSIETKEATT